MLQFAEEATIQVGQRYTVTIFHFGVFIKKKKKKKKNMKEHIVMISTYHLVSVYLKIIGKKMAVCELMHCLVCCQKN